MIESLAVLGKKELKITKDVKAIKFMVLLRYILFHDLKFKEEKYVTKLFGQQSIRYGN